MADRERDMDVLREHIRETTQRPPLFGAADWARSPLLRRSSTRRAYRPRRLIGLAVAGAFALLALVRSRSVRGTTDVLRADV
jgi:hypothetical protein